jgi:hypothetical protein
MIRRKRIIAALSVPARRALCPGFAEQETDYLAVFMEGKKVGYAIHTRTVEGRAGHHERAR